MAQARKAVEIFREEYAKQELQRRKTQGEGDISKADLSKVCSARWKELSKDEKARYSKMADKEKEKYGGGGGVGEVKKGRASSKGKKGKENNKDEAKTRKKKDPNAPKKGLSSYIFFSNDQREVVKREHPEMKGKEIVSELGRMWNRLDDEGKKKYEKMAKEDKKRYEVEMAAYKDANEEEEGGNDNDDGDE